MKIYIALIKYTDINGDDINEIIKSFAYEWDAQAYLDKTADELKNEGNTIIMSTFLLDEIEDYEPCVVASKGDFEKYDCSNVSDEEMKQMVCEVAKGMGNNDSVMECYWLSIDIVAENHGLIEADDAVWQIEDDENNIPDGLYSFQVFASEDDAWSYISAYGLNDEENRWFPHKYSRNDIEDCEVIDIDDYVE